MQSGIYTGQVRHRRFLPVENSFRYGLFLVYCDLSEMDQAFRASPFWSVNRFNLACFLRKDHFGDPGTPLETAVRSLVESRTGERPSGPVRLLCHFRYFGHCFNPASFYYFYNPEGTRLETIVVEIHNTPWGEVHCYVLDESRNQAQPPFRRYALEKEFHVSPYMAMDMHYEWRFREPGETVSVHMESFREKKKYFRRHPDPPPPGNQRVPPEPAALDLSTHDAEDYHDDLLAGPAPLGQKAPFYPHPPQKTEGGLNP